MASENRDVLFLYAGHGRIEVKCTRRDLNPGHELGKLRSYQARLRVRLIQHSYKLY